MIRKLIVFCAILFPWLARANDSKVTALAEATGAVSASGLLGAYLAFAHAEKMIADSERHPVTIKQILRHRASLNVIDKQVEKLRVTFSADSSFILFLERLMSATTAVTSQGDALIKCIRARDDTALKQAKDEREKARAILVPLMALPDDRDAVP